MKDVVLALEGMHRRAKARKLIADMRYRASYSRMGLSRGPELEKASAESEIAIWDRVMGIASAEVSLPAAVKIVRLQLVREILEDREPPSFWRSRKHERARIRREEIRTFMHNTERLIAQADAYAAERAAGSGVTSEAGRRYAAAHADQCTCSPEDDDCFRKALAAAFTAGYTSAVGVL
jgi:hypothetical protein